MITKGRLRMKWLSNLLEQYQVELYYVVRETGLHIHQLKQILDNQLSIWKLPSCQAIALLEFFEKKRTQITLKIILPCRAVFTTSNQMNCI